ncbi:MAG: hypothetical protein LUG98_09560 [Tannerellaceae bacterium]|nr:hypothetical protein [Tannerellaceae bacterium]
MKELLENIKETLENLLPNLTMVEIDWGQLNDDKPEADFPCALVGIHQVTYSQQGNGYQIAEPEITVTVAARQPNRFGFGITPLELLELTDQIHEVLQQHTHGDYSPLFRTSLARLKGLKNIYGYRITYHTAYTIPLTPTYGKTMIEDMILHLK